MKNLMGILLVNCGEDLGNWVLFFCFHQTPFRFCCCWDQKPFFHWRSTYWIDLPCSCSSCYAQCRGWIPRWPLHYLLGIYESPQPGRTISAKTGLPKASPQRDRGVSCCCQTTWWPHNHTHQFSAFSLTQFPNTR